MKDNTIELTDTTININIRTGLMHSNEREEAHTRVDYTGFYLSAINYFIRVALDAQSRLEMETNSISLRNDVEFRENLQFLIQIQEAFAEWLPDYSHAMHNEVFGMSEADGETGKFSTPVESSELENLAVKISEVMKNPLTPTNLYNVMSDELSHVTGFADSPEWILGNLKQQSAKE